MSADSSANVRPVSGADRRSPFLVSFTSPHSCRYLAGPLNHDEFGAPIPVGQKIFTGSNLVGGQASNCGDWTLTTQSDLALVGDPSLGRYWLTEEAKTATWTRDAEGSLTMISSAHTLSTGDVITVRDSDGGNAAVDPGEYSVASVIDANSVVIHPVVPSSPKSASSSTLRYYDDGTRPVRASCSERQHLLCLERPDYAQAFGQTLEVALPVCAESHHHEFLWNGWYCVPDRAEPWAGYYALVGGIPRWILYLTASPPVQIEEIAACIDGEFLTREDATGHRLCTSAGYLANQIGIADTAVATWLAGSNACLESEVPVAVRTPPDGEGNTTFIRACEARLLLTNQ